MTRARALKSLVRARAAKTGERYTTARRHVLQSLGRSGTPADTPPSAPAPTLPVVLDTAAPSRAAAATTDARGSVTNARVLARTGHDLAYWFGVLDAFGAVERGHTASARHVSEDHGVDGWYAQGITVAYERARGLRAINQRMAGSYEVSASKVVAAEVPAIVATLTEPRRRARWSADADAGLIGALARALRAPASKGFVRKANGHTRYRYAWDASTVEIDLEPKGDRRTSVVVRHLKLASANAVEERRAQWRAALAALAAALASRSKGAKVLRR
jgi:hypothetical protein